MHREKCANPRAMQRWTALLFVVLLGSAIALVVVKGGARPASPATIGPDAGALDASASGGTSGGDAAAPIGDGGLAVEPADAGEAEPGAGDGARSADAG